MEGREGTEECGGADGRGGAEARRGTERHGGARRGTEGHGGARRGTERGRGGAEARNRAAAPRRRGAEAPRRRGPVLHRATPPSRRAAETPRRSAAASRPVNNATKIIEDHRRLSVSFWPGIFRISAENLPLWCLRPSPTVGMTKIPKIPGLFHYFFCWNLRNLPTEPSSKTFASPELDRTPPRAGQYSAHRGLVSGPAFAGQIRRALVCFASCI